MTGWRGQLWRISKSMRRVILQTRQQLARLRMQPSEENGRECHLASDIWRTNEFNRGDLSTKERGEYIDAVLCLSKKPAKTPLLEFPGVRNRYDDFVATHINQTVNIHSTVSGSRAELTMSSRADMSSFSSQSSFRGIDTTSGLTKMLSELNAVIMEPSL
jgi:hypothetical protein